MVFIGAHYIPKMSEQKPCETQICLIQHVINEDAVQLLIL